MSTELEQRLRRLAADVDVDLGRAEQLARQARAARIAGRRRVLVGGAAAAAVAIVAGATGVAVLHRSGEDGGDDDVVTADSQAQATSATQDGIEVTVTAPTEAVAGTRLWFDVVVRNVGDAAIHWEAGGCAIPVDVTVGPSSGAASGGRADGPRWDGDVHGLGAWLGEHNTLPARQSHQPADLTGTREIACTADSRLGTIEPGHELRHRGSVELRVPPGDLPGGGRDELVVTFRPYTAAGDGEVASVGDPLAPVEVRAPLTVTDDPARTPDSCDAAVGAFAADPRLADWIAATSRLEQPSLVQEFDTELSWWRGAWELWVDPYWEGDRLLRMRYDPGAGEVVDVRTVDLGKSPDDEPGRVAVPGEEPDEIL